MNAGNNEELGEKMKIRKCTAIFLCGIHEGPF
jgi:hypothetical protein